MKRRKSLGLTFLPALVAVFFIVKLTQPWRWRGSLIAACEGADRIVVDLNTLPADAQEHAYIVNDDRFDIAGADNLEAFIDAIELEPNWWNGACRCYGEMRFDVFRGTERVAAVTFHHDRFLRWQDGAWWGDGNLSAASQRHLLTWLKSHGCPTGEEVHEQTVRECQLQRSRDVDP